MENSSGWKCINFLVLKRFIVEESVGQQIGRRLWYEEELSLYTVFHVSVLFSEYFGLSTCQKDFWKSNHAAQLSYWPSCNGISFSTSHILLQTVPRDEALCRTPSLFVYEYFAPYYCQKIHNIFSPMFPLRPEVVPKQQKASSQKDDFLHSPCPWFSCWQYECIPSYLFPPSHFLF